MIVMQALLPHLSDAAPSLDANEPSCISSFLRSLPPGRRVILGWASEDSPAR